MPVIFLLINNFTGTTKMSENKKTIETYMHAFEKGDNQKVLSCLTDDVVWVLPGAFNLAGKKAFEDEIRNEAFQGDPVITVTRMTEENDVVVTEGYVRTQKKSGEFINLTYCDVFEMQGRKNSKINFILMEVK